MTARARAALAAAVAAALAACVHGEPFRVPEQAPRGPLDAVFPRRLTFNQGQDLAPSWLPDGSAIVYSLERVDRADHDRCLAFLPAEGGSLRRVVCNRRLVADDSTDAYEEPAPGANGLIAYQRSSANVGFLSYRFRELVVAPLDSPLNGRALRSLPYGVPGAAYHYGLSHIRWLTDSTLVYLGDLLGYEKHRQDQPADTIVSGLKIMLVTLRAGDAVFQSLDGTDYATSVASGESTDVIYYTMGGDARVFRRALSTGVTTVTWDFGASGIARDIQVEGDRLVAVVGGDVTFAYEIGLADFAQRDGGGKIHAVDLTTGTDTVLDGGGRLYRHPALSPSGTRIVAESYANREADLWLLEVP